VQFIRHSTNPEYGDVQTIEKDLVDFCHMVLGGEEIYRPKIWEKWEVTILDVASPWKFMDDETWNNGPGHQPCNEGHPPERYFTLNLAALVRLGTLEFRSHSATYDPEQVLHWTVFHVAFVESFKNKKFFSNEKVGNANAELKELKLRQKGATLEGLKKALPGMEKTITYLSACHWSENKPGCDWGISARATGKRTKL